MKEKSSRGKDKIKNGDDAAVLVLYNDEVNTFGHVIKSLVEICGHDPVQAEQCAMIVHFKGSCEVKSGLPEILSAMSHSLNLVGLNSRVNRKS